jgi:hypothetical protein
VLVLPGVLLLSALFWLGLALKTAGRAREDVRRA